MRDVRRASLPAIPNELGRRKRRSGQAVGLRLPNKWQRRLNGRLPNHPMWHVQEGKMTEPRKRPSRLGLVLPLVAFGLVIAGYVVSLVIELT